MDPIITPDKLRAVPELSYLTATNVARYRAVMTYCYTEYQRLKYWLRPEEVHAGVLAWGVLDGYTLEQCMSDLESLKSWGNLASRHDGGRALSVEEYMRKKSQYMLTQYAIEIERMLEALEQVKGYGGSLETTYFDTITSCIHEVRLRALEFEPGEALSHWEQLYEAFKTMHENAADFIASIHSIQAEEMMATEGFLALKDNLVHYLQHFVKGLQRSAYKIEGQLQRIGDGLRDAYVQKVIEGELAKPRLEAGKSAEELEQELQQGWANLQRWFVGDALEPSELTLLERATKDAIAKVVRSAVRLQERRRGGVSRRRDLETLARRFAQLEQVEDAHRLAAYAFGLFATRHMQGQDERGTERADVSSWDEAPNVRLIRSRSRRRIGRTAAEPMRSHAASRAAYREQVQRQLEEERQFVRRMQALGSVRIGEMPVLRMHERLRLLQWIGRCTAAASRSFETADGHRITLSVPEDARDVAVLRSEDGELTMRNYGLEVAAGQEASTHG
ncbi:TIGR02677 family protein [Paenibacillus sp. IB182496]|uniref:TIGR02677 family protein n=1 Tax=Paenibacillus sabuli TaxID=2772509 RepID=A0A927BTU4_9BACL|nr:TIGR02677 family protein [Paenibacillus sabuli]MBD2846687.1 TIGR02677 family protein [Paenibacillus sabuli]